MALYGTLAIFVKELRSLIRDPHTIVHSVLIPLFLYPALLWCVIQGLAYVGEIAERQVSRVRVLESAEGTRVTQVLADDERFDVLGVGDVSAVSDEESATLAHQEFIHDIADAWILARPAAAGDSGGVKKPEFVLLWTSARDASLRAKERLVRILNDYDREELARYARDVGAKESFIVPITSSDRDLSTGTERGNYLASLILPLLMLIMIAIGALYPALDVSVGERERGSLETTLIAPVGRTATVVGKYLAVVSFSLLAFLLNFVSMALTLLHLGALLRTTEIGISLSSFLIIFCAALLLSGFFSAIMMLLAFQARTFKEGQSYVMSVYILAAVPALLMSQPDIEFGVRMAWIPVVNVAFLFRQALNGALVSEVTLVTLGSTFVYTSAVIALSVWCLRGTQLIADSADAPRSGWIDRWFQRRKGASR